MDFEIRSDDSLHIEGYVNAVERDSRVVIAPECGRCVEQIRAGAFAEALRTAENVDLLLNHDRGHKAGSTLQGNLRLTEDNIGLRASADISDGEIIEKARAGLLRGWSFGFTAKDTTIEQRAEGVPRRHVNSLAISEVSIIDDRFTPCYAGTSIEVRADGEELIETRFNPYHDPVNGRFTNSGGSNDRLNAAVHISKGDIFIKSENKSGIIMTDGHRIHRHSSLDDLDRVADSSNSNFSPEKLYNEQKKSFDNAFKNGMTKEVAIPEIGDLKGTDRYDFGDNAPLVQSGYLKDALKAVPGAKAYYRIDGKNPELSPIYFRNDNGDEVFLLPVRKSVSTRAVPELSVYTERYNKAVLDGYKIRAALLNVPP